MANNRKECGFIYVNNKTIHRKSLSIIHCYILKYQPCELAQTFRVNNLPFQTVLINNDHFRLGVCIQYIWIQYNIQQLALAIPRELDLGRNNLSH